MNIAVPLRQWLVALSGLLAGAVVALLIH